MAFAVLLCLSCSSSLRANQETDQSVSPPHTAETYPNTADSLHSLLTDLLTTAKSDDQGKLSSEIAAMEIPNYEDWFIRTYGQEKGHTLAGTYEKSLKPNEQHFEMLWVELAKQEGEISISRFDNATDEFKADWKKTDSSAGPARQAIGYFCFVDGKFRLMNFPYEVQILSTTKPGLVVAAKLVSRVPPVYPALARQARIQGLVSVNVVIQKDGTVTVQNVGAGHPLLAPAAVAAVKQWKYESATVSGEPVDVQAKIYVTFELTKP
jgi:TonB family protein